MSLSIPKTFLALVAWAALSFTSATAQDATDETNEPLIIESERGNFQVEKLPVEIELPWSMAFLPDGQVLLSEHEAGRLVRLNLETGDKQEITGLPEILKVQFTGLQHVILHPDYASNGWIYYTYNKGTEKASTLALERARIDDTKLVDRQTVFEAFPIEDNPDHTYHYGARILFHDGHLFLSVGDRHNRHRAQDLSMHNGSILRLNYDGSVPEGNPFADKENAQPEIWSYGHRNPQALAIHPVTNVLWQVEHGPKGGDEINIIKPGLNYGWPIITHGIEYDGTPVGDGLTHKEGLEQPRFFYTPAIAPSDMIFYTGELFSAWRNNMFVTSMARPHLRRIEIEGDRILHEEVLLLDMHERMRFVRQGPDGAFYLGTDDSNIYRLTPVN